MIFKFFHIIFLILLVLFSACSSSSYSSRYDENDKKDYREVENSGSVRFTDAEDYDRFNDEFDEEPTEEIKVDINDLSTRYSDIEKSNLNLDNKDQILIEVIKYINTPYKYGGVNKNGIDCSAFTQNVFSQAVNFKLPRTAKTQFAKGNKINGIDNLKFGDLVFFDTRKASYPGHVGIYLGENMFAHASVSKGVTVSSLESSYYKKRFVGGRRVIKSIN